MPIQNRQNFLAPEENRYFKESDFLKAKEIFDFTDFRQKVWEIKSVPERPYHQSVGVHTIYLIS